MSLSYLIDRRLTRRVGTRWTCSSRVKAKRLRYRDCREMSSVGETGGYAAWFEWFDPFQVVHRVHRKVKMGLSGEA